MRRVVEASSLESIEDLLCSTYGSMRIDPRGERRELRLEHATLGPVQFHRITAAMNYEASVAPQGTLVFGALLSGRLRHSSAGGDRRYLPGDFFLAGQPDESRTASVRDVDTRLVVIDPALPSEVADTAPRRAPAPVRFTGYQPVSARAAAFWKATCDYVHEHLLADPESPPGPLVTASAVRLLVATALTTFPNNALTDPTIEDRHDASPATLRRAIAFIDEHAHQDISMEDIAAACGVTVRAVQLAFRRHLDTTPTRYLRRVRLDYAHHQLVAADPERDSVTAVSYQWGFASSSRFAAYYRSVYGVSPSFTLHAR
jgi:AraC-like DNA-binding protein